MTSNDAYWHQKAVEECMVNLLIRDKDATPHWEHGYRCHGYWRGTIDRVGFISLPPLHMTQRMELPYGWSCGKHQGRCKTLAQAKRAVETAYREGNAA